MESTEARRARKERYRAAGLCVRCGHTNDSAPLVTCSRCRKTNAAYRRSNWGRYAPTWRAYREKHREKYAEYYKARTRNWGQRLRRQAERRRIDPHFRLAQNLRTRLNQAVRKGQKAGSAVRDLGCTIEEFRDYIAARFMDGMSWENYGEWELDHIRPLAAFDLTNREEFLRAAHYSNYQPLWREENLRKSAKEK